MKLLAVIDKNRALGYKNDLLFHLPSDLAHFKKHTLGQTVVMGQKTLESMPGGKALKGRNTLVLYADAPTAKLYDVDDVKDGCGKTFVCYTFNNLDDFHAYINEHKEELGEIVLSGGATIYKLLLDECDELVITEVETEAQQVDVWFPKFRDKFHVVSEDGPYFDGMLLYTIRTYKKND